MSTNEARPHLLADIITLERQEEAVLVQGVITSLAEVVGQEALTQTQRANSLQFSLEVGVIPSYNLETGL